MITIGSFEAKTHLSKLLERAKQGEEIIITKHGEPVARLSPANQTNLNNNASIKETFKQIEKNKISLSRKKGENLKDLIHQGHKY